MVTVKGILVMFAPLLPAPLALPPLPAPLARALLLPLPRLLLPLLNPTTLGFSPPTASGHDGSHDLSKFTVGQLHSSAKEVGGIFGALFAHVAPKVNLLIGGGGGARGGGAAGL